MWKFKYAWPVYVSFILSGANWVLLFLYEYKPDPYRDFIENLQALFGFGTVIWLPILTTILFYNNRFKGGMFWGFMVVIIFGMFILASFIFGIMSGFQQTLGVYLGIISLNTLYTIRHFRKPSRLLSEWGKWGILLLIAGLFPGAWFYWMNMGSPPQFFFNETIGYLVLAIWNLLAITALLLNLHDLHRRDQQKQQAGYEQLVEEVGAQ